MTQRKWLRMSFALAAAVLAVPAGAQTATPPKDAG